MGQRFSFNINAELYENEFGELAVKFPDGRVYREIGTGSDESFPEDIVKHLESGLHPDHWREMPAHELLYGRGWQCIGRLGFIDGEETRPALEFEVDPRRLGARSRSYLREVLH